MQFKNKKVIVTGANRSMGREMAVAFAREGADVVISYRSDKDGADETVKKIQETGRKGLAIYADFSQMEDVTKFAKAAIVELGQVDVLINNAGMLARENIFQISPEKMQLVFQVNAVAPLYLTQLCINDMLEKKIKGSVISISSIAAEMTVPRGVGYASSKAAVNKWTENVALNLAASGIRVNVIAPGVIEAGMNGATAQENPELWESYMKGIPMGKPGQPADIANMALFLASEQAHWITGRVFAVDGGHLLNR